MGNDVEIVYISGVWDLFHIGHLNVLRDAKALGDILVVGVVTDEFATEYKGQSPIIPFAHRYAIVKSIWYVDAVVPVRKFTVPLYGVTIRAHGPDYGTYAGQQAVLRQLTDLGIRTVLISRTPGVSTTSIKERMREQ